MTARSASFHDAICDYRIYERQIERLHSRGRGLEQREVSLGRLNSHRSNVARMLARAVACGEYRSTPARRKTIVVEGKERVIFSYRLADLIVHGAVADAIAEAVAPCLSAQLYSYRKGTGWWTAVADFADYVREYRNRYPDPKQRHLYVLRRDIDSYTDSIPVGEGAPVWEMLRRLLAPLAQPALPIPDWNLVERVVRPEVEIAGGGGTALLDRGVPTGQPISCVLFNFYLAELDRQFEAMPGGFYARYSDDILFAHPSAEVARRTGAELDASLAKLGLRVSPAKSLNVYLTGAGRPSLEWPEAAGTSSVPFMGTAIQADGTVSLGRKKTRHLLRDLRSRARRVARSLAGTSTDEVGRALCASVYQMLTPDWTPCVEARSAALLRRAITDRRQLAQLDHWIARIVLRAVTGDGSVRAFRKISYRKLREEWGLISLEHARNRWGRKGDS
jgi:hypothetical protein